VTPYRNRQKGWLRLRRIFFCLAVMGQTIRRSRKEKTPKSGTTPYPNGASTSAPRPGLPPQHPEWGGTEDFKTLCFRSPPTIL
jgi:hypothetical protein